MTQAYPTNFHTFHTRKVLVGDEKVSDFKEVTAAERHTIEARDARWEQPDDALLSWCRIEGVTYNESTGFFELNGLTDLTAADTRKILKAGRMTNDTTNYFYINTRIRTNLPARVVYTIVDGIRTFLGCNTVEVADCGNIIPHHEMFYGCTNLKQINLFAPMSFEPKKNVYEGCVSLETIEMNRVYYVDTNFSDSPLLSLATFRQIVHLTPADNAKAFTITVHPDVYAKLTDETNTEWHQVLLDAVEKQITFVTPT